MLAAGLQLGSVDLPDWKALISADPSKQSATISKTIDHLKKWADLAGPTNHFVVMLPENPQAPRSENFDHMIKAFSELSPAFEANEAKLVIEGWPGPGALCCTPETLRAFFDACPSPALCLNYDPSHLIRLGVDPIRFLDEFINRVYHAHAKDTEIYTDAIYEIGLGYPATFAKGHKFGDHTWRYTIPGHGCMPWIVAFERLSEHGYEGHISIELEDQNFNGTEEGEKQGLLLSQKFLEGC